MTELYFLSFFDTSKHELLTIIVAFWRELFSEQV